MCKNRKNGLIVSMIVLSISLQLLFQAQVMAQIPDLPGNYDRQFDQVFEGQTAIKIIKSNTESEVKVFTTDEIIGKEKIVVGKGTTIAYFLINNKIKPDAYSLGLVMDLNPAIKNIKEILEGQEIIIPKINQAVLNLKNSAGFRFHIAGNYDQHMQLQNAVLGPRQALDEIVGYEVERFENKETKEKFVSLSNDILELANKLKFLPQSRSTLERTNKTVTLFSSTLTAAQSQANISGDFLTIMEAEKNDLTFVAASAEMGVNVEDPTVSIATIREGQEVRNLSIRCKKEAEWKLALKRKQDPYQTYTPFSSPTSPAIQTLDEDVFYYFWVVDEGAGDKIVKKEERREVKKGTKCETGGVSVILCF